MWDMGVFNDEFVVVRRGHHQGDPSEITINCPDKVGLGCDLARIVFEFGLSVTKGDVSTDGRWCFVVLWVVPRASPSTVRWSLLKQRLEDVCPSAVASLLPPPVPAVNQSKRVLLLQVYSVDRTGLLNDVTQKLWEMELTIHKLKVSTSPDGKAVNLFFVTDNRNKTPWKKKAEEVKEQIKELLGDTCTHVDLTLAGPECEALRCEPLPLLVTKDLLDDNAAPWEPEKEKDTGGAYIGHIGVNTTVTIDNSIFPAHSLLQVTSRSRKGLLYDCLRTIKHVNLQVAYGRIATLENGNTEISVFVLRADGRKITDIREQKVLCKCMHDEVENPLRVKVGTRGPEWGPELVVATPIELCGRGRPRVLYDVTLALKMLDICIFKADVGRHVVDDRHWEIYRFLLIDRGEFSLTSGRIRNLITERVQHILMG